MLLAGPADGPARWHRLAAPRPAWRAVQAAAPGLALALGRAYQDGGGLTGAAATGCRALPPETGISTETLRFTCDGARA